MINKRWSTIYDFEQLQSQIKDILKNNYKKGFYLNKPEKHFFIKEIY